MESETEGEDLVALEVVLSLVDQLCLLNKAERERGGLAHIKKGLVQPREKPVVDEKAARNCLELAAALQGIVSRVIRPQVYILDGCHGNVLFEDVGYCECADPEKTRDGLYALLDLAARTGCSFNVEFGAITLKHLARRYPGFRERVCWAIESGKIEFVNGTYSLPYALSIGMESNIRQFQLGLETMIEEFGFRPYVFAHTEHGVHPQTPQLLKGFGYRFASSRVRLMGTSPSLPVGKFWWQGLDGSTIETLPPHQGVFSGECFHGMFYRFLPFILTQANRRSSLYAYVAVNLFEDHTFPVWGREEVMRAHRLAPILGKYVTYTDFFRATPPADGTYFLPRDCFRLSPFPVHEILEKDREGEHRLVAAEVLDSLAHRLGFPSRADELVRAWAALLGAQNHDTYVVPWVRPAHSDESLTVEQKGLQLAGQAVTTAEQVAEAQLRAIASMVEAEAPAVVVFNPLSWARQEVVRIHLADARTGRTVVDGKGKSVPCQSLGEELAFLADVPPMGYRAYRLASIGPPGKPVTPGLGPTVEGDRILLVSGERPLGCLYLTAGDGSPAVVETVEVERGPLLSGLRLHGRLGAHPFSWHVSAAVNATRLDFSLQTEEENAAVVLEGAHSQPRFYTNYPFGIEETRLRLVQSLDFLRIEGAEAVLTFIHTGMQHFEIGTGGRVRNLLVGHGRYRFAVAVSSAADEDRATSLRLALEFYSPLLWALIGPQEGKLPGAMSFLSLSDQEILATSLRIKGDGLFLRLFNPTQRRRATWLELVGLQGAHLVDFQHRLLDPLVAEGEKVRLGLNPWQIRTLKLEVKDKGTPL